ncbi:hypothetical protein SAMN06295987_10793 [Novosphingobium mathurense]|uniref:Uncharacterized protein n=1 Tax=Novosphingobium mathurense TaxID=428990 RepID=A0A1U6IIU6_9SPHN|nr:hypothetical protein SAMN06295987_10793 [Novosphingobium mathurense]
MTIDAVSISGSPGERTILTLEEQHGISISHDFHSNDTSHDKQVIACLKDALEMALNCSQGVFEDWQAVFGNFVIHP